MTTKKSADAAEQQASAQLLAQPPALTWQPCQWTLPPIAAGRPLAGLITQPTGHVVLAYRPSSEMPQQERERVLSTAAELCRQRISEELAGLDPRGLQRISEELRTAPAEVQLAEALETEAAARLRRLEIDTAAGAGERVQAEKELNRARQALERSRGHLTDLQQDLDRRRATFMQAVRVAADKVVAQANEELVALQDRILADLGERIGADLARLALIATTLDDGRRRSLAPHLAAEVLAQAGLQG